MKKKRLSDDNLCVSMSRLALDALHAMHATQCIKWGPSQAAAYDIAPRHSPHNTPGCCAFFSFNGRFLSL